MVVVAEVVSNSFIAFGFARLRAPGRNFLFYFVLATLMIPGEVTLIPQYMLFARLGWLNSFKPLIVPAWFGSAYLIFLLRQFYMSIPKEYDEAALIEGASWLTIWYRITSAAFDAGTGRGRDHVVYLSLESLPRTADLHQRQQSFYALPWPLHVPNALWRYTLALVYGSLTWSRFCLALLSSFWRNAFSFRVLWLAASKARQWLMVNHG